MIKVQTVVVVVVALAVAYVEAYVTVICVCWFIIFDHKVIFVVLLTNMPLTVETINLTGDENKQFIVFLAFLCQSCYIK